jgi:hypothetical protein
MFQSMMYVEVEWMKQWWPQFNAYAKDSLVSVAAHRYRISTFMKVTCYKATEVCTKATL